MKQQLISKISINSYLSLTTLPDTKPGFNLSWGSFIKYLVIMEKSLMFSSKDIAFRLSSESSLALLKGLCSILLTTLSKYSQITVDKV